MTTSKEGDLEQRKVEELKREFRYWWGTLSRAHDVGKYYSGARNSCTRTRRCEAGWPPARGAAWKLLHSGSFTDCRRRA